MLRPPTPLCLCAPMPICPYALLFHSTNRLLPVHNRIGTGTDWINIGKGVTPTNHFVPLFSAVFLSVFLSLHSRRAPRARWDAYGRGIFPLYFLVSDSVYP